MADTRVKIVDIQVNITSAVQALAQYGQAIDEAKVKQKKIELGLITPDEPVDLSEAQKIVDEATKVTTDPSDNETGAGEGIPSDEPEVEKQSSRRGRPSSK